MIEEYQNLAIGGGTAYLLAHGMKRGLRSPFSNQVPPVIQGTKVTLPNFQFHIRSSETEMVRWMRGTSEFD